MKKVVIRFLLILFGIVFVYSLYHIIRWNEDNKHTEQILKEIQEIKEIENNETVQVDVTNNINFNELIERNSDTVGWITVNNTNIDYPIVQASNNEYYLNHSFDRKYTDAGWVFEDYRNNKFNETDKSFVR